MVIDYDKVALRENLRMNGPIVLTFDLMFMSLVGQGHIVTLFIKLLKVY